MSHADAIIHYPEDSICEQIDTLETHLARALLTVASAIPALASSAPRCDGECKADAGTTCGEIDRAVSTLLPDLAASILGIIEAVGFYAQLITSRFGVGSPAAVAQANDSVQAIVDGAVDVDATLIGLRVQARQLATIAGHEAVAKGVLHLVRLMAPATTAVGDLVEAILT